MYAVLGYKSFIMNAAQSMSLKLELLTGRNSLSPLFPSPERMIWLFSCYMLHNFQQLLANFVCIFLTSGSIQQTC